MMNPERSFQTYQRTAHQLCNAICDRGGIVKSEIRTMLRIVRDERFGDLDAGTVITLSNVYRSGPKVCLVS